MNHTLSTTAPKVSVIMTAFNAERYIHQAIASILAQTLHEIELIIVNDGSNDKTQNIINSFEDDRIIILVNNQNKGQSYSRNLAINRARAEYIAIMDADDIAAPERITEQYHYLEQNPNISICATWADVINENGKFVSQKISETNPDLIRLKLLFECPIVHPTVMLRKSEFMKNQLFYDEYFVYAQDYDLWTRALDTLEVGVIPKSLLKLRFHNPHSVSVKRKKEQLAYSTIIRNRYICKIADLQRAHDVLKCTIYDIYIYKKIINNKNFMYGKRELKSTFLKAQLFDKKRLPHSLKATLRNVFLS